MDFLIKIAETGKTYPYTGISLNEKISLIQEKIKQDSKIDIKDQILITKKGFKLKADDVLYSLETENIFQSTMHSENNLNKMKQYYTIFVFNEKTISANNNELYYRDQNKENLIKEFLETNQDFNENYLITSKIIEKDYPRNFEKDFPIEKEKLKILNSEIFVIEELLFNHYQTIKKKYLDYIGRFKKVDKSIIECENQMQSFDVILKQTSQFYQSAKVKKNELQKRLKDNSDKNGTTVKKFEESIEMLKKIEIHEKLRTETVKVLLDIYYNPEAMLNWKLSCISLQTRLKTKCEKVVGYLKMLKKKIKDERNTTIANAINNYKMQRNAFDGFYHETETVMLSLLSEIYEDYRKLRKNMENFIENNDDLFIMGDLEKISGKIDHYNEQIALCNENNEKLIRFNENVLKTKSNLEQLIISEYKIMHKYINELSLINNDKIKHLNEEIDQMEKDFAYLLSPLSLPSAYNASLSEVSRRREFSQLIDHKVEKIQKIIELEKDKRKKFLSDFGKILPNEFIPQLKMFPNMSISYQNNDIDLPKIEGYHNPKDSYISKDKNEKSLTFDTLNKSICDINSKISLFSKEIDQKIDPQRKISTLTELLQQTSKLTYNIFMNKLSEKQFEISKIESESILEKNKLILNYDEQISNLNFKCSELELNLPKIKAFELENEKLKKDLKLKNELLKLNEEKAKNLTKEISDLKDKISNYERKIKQEHTEVLTKIHDLHRVELDKLKNRLKWAENEFSAKNIENEKNLKSLNETNKEIKNINDELNIKINEYNSLLKEKEKLKEELMKFNNKIENLEIIVGNKNNEIQNLTKNNKEINFEKNNLINENSSLKYNLTDLKGKNQKLIDSLKIIELEKENLKNKINKLNIEIEKKNTEIENFQKNANEQKSQTDSIETEKEKLVLLNEELSKNRMEMAVLQTKIELMHADMENKTDEVNVLKNEIRSINEEREELRILNEHLQVENNLTDNKNNELNEEMNKIKKEFNEKQIIIEQEKLLNNQINTENEEFKSLIDSLKSELDALRIKNELIMTENDTIKQNNLKLKEEYEILKQSKSEETNPTLLIDPMEQTKDDLNQLLTLLDDKTLQKSSKVQELFKSYVGLLDIIEYNNLTIGMKYIFIPVTQGIYTPLILKQISSDTIINEDIYYKSYKNNFFLDSDCIDLKYKDLVNECSLIIVAKVKEIQQLVNNKEINNYNIKLNEIYYNIVIENPEFIVGFEGDDFAIRNYVN